MTVRAATSADAKAICAIWNPTIRDSVATFNSQEKSTADVIALIEQRRSSGYEFLVAEDDDQILGFASYSQFRGGIGYAKTMEHTVILAPQAQGRGVGRALMQAIEDHARGQGYHSMFAGVSGENPAAIAFHAALGYRQVAVLPEVGFKFGRWMDLHLMQKLL